MISPWFIPTVVWDSAEKPVLLDESREQVLEEMCYCSTVLICVPSAPQPPRPLCCLGHFGRRHYLLPCLHTRSLQIARFGTIVTPLQVLLRYQHIREEYGCVEIVLSPDI